MNNSPIENDIRKILSDMEEKLQELIDEEANKRQNEELYESNCRLLMNINKDPKSLSYKLQDFSSTNFSLVYFDIETSGFPQTADILQIAAKFKENTFNVYIKPTQKIDDRSSQATGLHIVEDNLYLHGKLLETITLKEALNSFLKFLNISSEPCILIAHNCSFDSSRLLRAIINLGMVEDFQKIAGFTDTLKLFKTRFPDRKGLFKLEELAKDFLPVQPSEHFHNALYDVEILQKLSDQYLKKMDLIENCVAYEASVMKKITLSTLKPLKNIISDEMIRRLASNFITFDDLRNNHKNSGFDGIKQILSSPNDNGKPRITKHSKVMNKICEYLNKNI